jgi:hypothetical protein
MDARYFYFSQLPVSTDKHRRRPEAIKNPTPESAIATITSQLETVTLKRTPAGSIEVNASYQAFRDRVRLVFFSLSRKKT